MLKRRTWRWLTHLTKGAGLIYAKATTSESIKITGNINHSSGHFISFSIFLEYQICVPSL